MATTKTATLTCHIDPGVREALRTAARQEHRSIASMVEVLIRDYCGRNGIPIEEPTARPGTGKGSAQYVVIVQYPIEEEKGSVGSSSLHVKHYPETAKPLQ